MIQRDYNQRSGLKLYILISKLHNTSIIYKELPYILPYEIKMSGSESHGQEEAYMLIFRPKWSLLWVIYMDGRSKILKCYNLAAIVAVAGLLKT